MCDRWSTVGITSRFAAAYDRSLSVMIRFGVRRCLFSNLTSSPGNLPVATRLDDFIENIAVLVDGSPKPAFPTANGNYRLVQMPNVLSGRLFSAQLLGIGRTELATPSANGLVRHDNAAFQKHFLRQAQAQQETEIQPHPMRNDVWWKTVVFVAGDR